MLSQNFDYSFSQVPSLEQSEAGFISYPLYSQNMNMVMSRDLDRQLNALQQPPTLEIGNNLPDFSLPHHLFVNQSVDTKNFYPLAENFNPISNCKHFQTFEDNEKLSKSEDDSITPNLENDSDSPSENECQVPNSILKDIPKQSEFDQHHLLHHQQDLPTKIPPIEEMIPDHPFDVDDTRKLINKKTPTPKENEKLGRRLKRKKAEGDESETDYASESDEEIYSDIEPKKRSEGSQLKSASRKRIELDMHYNDYKQALRQRQTSQPNTRSSTPTPTPKTQTRAQTKTKEKSVKTKRRLKNYIQPKKGRRSRDVVQNPSLLESGKKIEFLRDPNLNTFVCSTCGQHFKRLEHVQRHFLMHTGERPFLCRVCNKGFSRADNLKKHLELH